jgi:hypothetical protein
VRLCVRLGDPKRLWCGSGRVVVERTESKSRVNSDIGPSHRQPHVERRNIERHMETSCEGKLALLYDHAEPNRLEEKHLLISPPHLPQPLMHTLLQRLWPTNQH